MPETVDSVIVYRCEEFAATDPAIGPFVAQLGVDGDGEEAKVSLKAYIAAAAAKAKPRVWARGGSGFRLPPDLGIGNFNERNVTQTTESLKSAIEALVAGEAGPDAPAAIAVDERTVYHGPVTITFYGGTAEKERFYFCLADDRTLLTAESEADIRAMLAQLEATGGEQQPPVPERWKELAERAVMKSPLLVLRRFKDPENPVLAENAPKPPEEWRCAGYAVWLPEAKSACAKVVIHTPEGADNSLLLETMQFEKPSPIDGGPWTAAESCGGGQRMNVVFLFPMMWFGTTPMI